MTSSRRTDEASSLETSVSAATGGPIKYTRRIPPRPFECQPTCLSHSKARSSNFFVRIWKSSPGVQQTFQVYPGNSPSNLLQVYPNARTMKQSLHRFSEPKCGAIGEEINILLEAKFIRKIKKATWVANPMLVSKNDMNIMWMCVDYGPINEHCSKEHFPLPRIDQIVDSTTSCARLSFLDAYLGYNQIIMKVDDEKKTTFHTPYGVFCYTTTPFGLKNAGPIY